jgi:CubicO group peptidase (beta-lactamase class C family)
VPSRAALLFLGLVFVIVTAGGCAHPQPSTKKPPAPETVEDLKKAVAEILTRNHIPGAGITLVTNDKVIWTGGVGKADLATGRDADADTMFRIGSITKGFVALSLLQLQEKGKVSLDAKVADLAPEVPIVNRWEQTDPVRIANLLEHTAGFDDFPLAELYDFTNGPPIPLLTTLQRFPEPQVVRWRPGTFASYSNPGYGVAGYVVEKVTGQPFEDYVVANILRPLGMTHSDLRLTPEVKAALAQGYEFDPPRPVAYLPILLRPAGEMKSSANEMARFVQMMLNRGELEGVRIVSADSIARMEVSKTSLAARSGLKYGYGLGNIAQVDQAFITHGHDGGLDGFLSDYRYIPDLGVGYFFSVNDSQASDGPRELNDLLLAYLTRGKNPPPKTPQMQLDSRIENAAGLYELASPRSQWAEFIAETLVLGWTYIDNGRLYRKALIPGGPPEALVYLGDGQIRTDKEAAASGVYCSDQDGSKYGCGALSCFRLVSPAWPIARLVLIAASILVMASSILFALVWMPRKLIGRMRGVGNLSVRVVPMLAVLSVIAMFWTARGQPPMVLGQIDAVTVAILVMSILFPVLSLFSLLVALRSFKFEMNRAVRIHSLVVAVACCGITWFFGYWGLIGVRIWAL